MAELSLVMPMAGRGSRFARDGVPMPKPLIDLEGRPFFWWAIESLAQQVQLRELVVVVLEEHIEQFSIDRRIAECYPDAAIVALPEVTSGAAETAALGIAALKTTGPLAINDCDHAFRASKMSELATKLESDLAGALVSFRSQSPNYSYLYVPEDGARVTGTVEKKVVSPWAIAGCYLFSSPAIFEEGYAAYQEVCPYDELFVSGIYDVLCQRDYPIGFAELDDHVSFGTPEELDALDHDRLNRLFA